MDGLTAEERHIMAAMRYAERIFGGGPGEWVLLSAGSDRDKMESAPNDDGTFTVTMRYAGMNDAR